MNPLRHLAALGQSVYLDEIGRRMLRGGDLARRIAEDGLHGVTSNPAIFAQAISATGDYDAAIADLAADGLGVEAIYETLAIEDVQDAADLFRETFERSDGEHGYVSLEVSPELADDADATVAEARRLWRALARPNVFVKVPGTHAGLAAIRRLTAEGVNLNVTLLFGLPRYQAVADAYLDGLEDRRQAGAPLHTVSSVASFFLSRIDVAIDPLLDAVAADPTRPDDDRARARRLRGRAAVASAKRAAVIHAERFGGERFAELAALGARPQRLLWASTGVKDPTYPATAYVEPLVGAGTITTLPRATLDAYRASGAPAPRLHDGLGDAAKDLRALADLGIDLDAITHRLEREGIDAFVAPYRSLLAAIEATAASAARRRSSAT